MKVNKTSKSAKTSGKRTVQNVSTSEVPLIKFTEVLAHKDHERQKEALQKALDIIDVKGQQLLENRTVENLYEYKKLIKSFIDEVVSDGFEISEKRGFSRVGRAKVLRTVSEVDAKLVELTNLILKREHKEINILKKVGEIKGLLVNLLL